MLELSRILPGDFEQEQRLAVEATAAAAEILRAPLLRKFKSNRRFKTSAARKGEMCDFCITGRHLSCLNENCTCIHRRSC